MKLAVVFMITNGQHIGRVIQNTTPITIASKKKYFRLKLTMARKELYSEVVLLTLKKDIEGDTKKW